MFARSAQKKGISRKGTKFKLSVLFLIAVMILLSGLYLSYIWNRYQTMASDEAISLAESLESFLHSDQIAVLSGSADDLQKPEYITTKQSLKWLVEVKNQIRFAYLMALRDGKVIFLMDSESPESLDYSPPGQVYAEADKQTFLSFTAGKTVLTRPSVDRWGTWVSVMVPIKNSNGNTIAVFGIDYSAEEWNLRIWERMIADIVIVFCVFSLFIAWLLSRTRSALLKELGKKLALDEALYHSVFNQAPIGIAIVNDKSFVNRSEFGNSNINPTFERILGRSSRELTEVKWPDITHPDDLKPDLDHFELFKSGKTNGYTMEKRFIKPDGSAVWTNMKISAFLNGPENSPMHLCLLEDISARKETEESLRESERSKSVLISNLPGMAYRCNFDREWTMQFISDGCFSLTGYHPENLLYNRDLSFNDLIVPEYRESLWEEWNRILILKKPFRYEYEINTADGKRKWVLEMGQGVYNEHGDVEALEGIILDISASKEIENIFKYNSEHDIWTGLYNRRYLENLLYEDAKKLSTKKRAVISINLGAVYSLSLKYGFQYSQELIRKAAKKLETLCTESRQLFNTYENRFAFYIKEYKDQDELTALCETIVGILKTMLSVERIGGGIGIIEIDDDNKSNVDLLLKNLLVASERAINLFQPDIGICFFDKEMSTQIARDEAINRELTQIAAGEHADRLFLQFQPVLDLETNQINGFEALARLRNDNLGLVSPAEFIPIAERTNLIIPLGYQIIRKSFAFLNRIRQEGFDDVSISVNISAIQLLKNDFTENLFAIIDEMQTDSSNIALELTESIFAADNDEINNILSTLKTRGIRIFLDDFGVGYSSLARERELDIDCLKIDKYFMVSLLFTLGANLSNGDILSFIIPHHRVLFLPPPCPILVYHFTGTRFDPQIAELFIQMMENQT